MANKTGYQAVLSKNATKEEKRIASAFSRFPMLMVKIVEAFRKGEKELLLEDFCERIKYPVEAFKNTCNTTRIFNSSTIAQIGVFSITQRKNKEHTYDVITLQPNEIWGRFYKMTRINILQE